MASRSSQLARLRARVRHEAEAYRNGYDRPLGGYVALMTAYAAGTGAGAAAVRALGRPRPDRLSAWEVVQLAAATHKLSRLLAKDPVTSPLRVPFTTFEGTAAPSELHEEVRGDGLRHAVGELVTCPMCLGQWVAAALCFGLTLAPAPTRVVLAAFTAIAGADFLQHAYAAVQQVAEQ